MMIARPSLLAVLVVAALLCGVSARPCRVGGQPSAVGMVREADVIVRVTPEFYVHAASDPTTEPDSRIQFKVLEVIRGEMPAGHLVLRGTLVDTDDFNDHEPPYNFVRPDGRRGSCFASSYRSSGQFVLMLKRNRDGELTVNWYPLAPVNEQLRSSDDPWLRWVRKEAQKPRNTSSKEPR
jgi:hypothetical protein